MLQKTEYFDLAAAPARIGRVRLRVRDLARVAAFYRDALGLVNHVEEPGRVSLGTRTAPLLDLIGDPTLAPLDRREAGLYHTAFLLPSRADLARWLGLAAERRLPLQGASDHRVSEAIYLADPEGNGIEVYADRPAALWQSADGTVEMTTDPLAVEDLLASAGSAAWAGAPDGTVVGHLHLQVGDTAEAERFYGDVLGFTVTRRRHGASFFGSGGYHHQLAANVWGSRGAGRRSDRMAGLDGFEIVVQDSGALDGLVDAAGTAGLAVGREGDRATLRDPWGTAVTLRR